MKTGDEVECEFRDELKALLKKYNAEIEALNDSGVIVTLDDVKINVFIPIVRVKNDIVSESAFFSLYGTITSESL